MAAITADNTIPFVTKLLSPDGYYVDVPLAASTTIYRWSFVGLDANGNLVSYVAPIGSTTITGNVLIGIAVQNVDNSSGSAGDKTCKVFVKGYVTFALSGVAITDVGGCIMAADNSSVTITAGLGHYAGRVIAYDRSGYATMEFDPQAKWAGKFLTVVSPAISFITLNELVLLVHETENINGIICCCATGYSTIVHVCTSTAGIVTIGHTRGTDTSMGVTLLAVDASAALDSIVAAGGQMWAPASASDDAIVVAPAGTAIVAKTTTASNDGTVETGEAKIFAQFMAL